MLICKLSISYERGLARNQKEDVTTEGQPTGFILGNGAQTKDGKIIRGLGTHYKSKEDADLVALRDKHAREIYQAVRERFLSLPIDGCFAAPQKGVFKKFALSLLKRDDMRVRVSEFELTTNGDMDAAEIKDWADKIRRQLGSVQLGRSKEADAEGLKALDYLATCPLLSKKTGQTVRELVAMVRENKLDRVELKRKISILDVEIETKTLEPHRSLELA